MIITSANSAKIITQHEEGTHRASPTTASGRKLTLMTINDRFWPILLKNSPRISF